MADSSIHGIYYRFYPSGAVAETATYDKGKRQGVRYLFYENGQIEDELPYRDDILHGTKKHYYDTGGLQLECEVVQGKIQGIFKAYYPNGQVKEEVTFVDDLENGPFTEYHENGKLKTQGAYRNGDKEFGLLSMYDEAGLLVKKMECDTMGICRTIWTADNENPAADVTDK